MIYDKDKNATVACACLDTSRLATLAEQAHAHKKKPARKDNKGKNGSSPLNRLANLPFFFSLTLSKASLLPFPFQSNPTPHEPPKLLKSCILDTHTYIPSFKF